MEKKNTGRQFSEEDADRTKWQNEYNKGEYDGIIDLKSQTWYVEDPTQIKSATDNIGTFDRGSKKIRYSRKAEGDGDGTKVTVNIPMANRSQFKIYTKENAEQIIISITHRLLGFNDGTQGVIKDKGELVDIIWQRLNTAPKDKQGGVALDIADEVIKRIAVKIVYNEDIA